MHNLSLIFYTVFAQAATGLLFFMGVHKLISPKQDVSSRGRVDYPLIFMWILFILASVSSVFHLGTPSNIFNVFNGIGSSPLSIEVSATVLFGAITFLYSFAHYKLGFQGVTKALLVLSMISALSLCFAIANVYTIKTIPLWNSNWTLIQFFMTVLALGCSGMIFFVNRGASDASNDHLMQWNLAGIIVLLALTIASTAFIAWSGSIVGQGGMPEFFGLTLIRIGLQVLGLIGLVLISMHRTVPSAPKYLCIFLCILSSELAGRIVFYDLQATSGMLQVFSF